jgi:hypothetical protein
MIAPNKAVPIEASALGRSEIILERGPAPIELRRLYQDVSKRFESIDQFLLTLDLLYLLGRLDIDFQKKMVSYVD